MLFRLLALKPKFIKHYLIPFQNMSDQQSTRRKFLQLIGLSAGATVVSSSVFAGSINNTEILKLNDEQQEFMLLYEKWMDEFIEVIKVQKQDANNLENQKRMTDLTEIAHEWQPTLIDYMKDEKFAVIYKVSIERMKKEI